MIRAQIRPVVSTMTLAHDRTGSGPPIVLLHPLGADRRVWDGVVGPLVAAGHQVIAVDLPGFGDSPPLPMDERPTPVAIAHAVAGFLGVEEIDAATVVGNSLGGWVALELGLVSAAGSVVAIAPAGLWPAPLAPRRSVARFLSRVGRPLVGPATRTATGRRLLLGGAVARPELVPAQAAARLIRSYASAPDFPRVNAAMRAADPFRRLEEIAVPVTLVWPERDTVVDRPRRLPSQIESIVLPQAGHIPMLEAPEAVAALLVRVAAATAGRRSARPPAAR